MEKYQKLRQRSIKIIAICLPILFFAVFEILLRLFHVGYSTQLFIEDDRNDTLVHNNLHISRLFFNNWDAAPNSYVQYFARVKPENTFRIFVLGESSALGFPYNHRGSFPRMLQYMLDKTCKEKKVEVINLAITAVNSYALLTFAGEIVQMSPDAILIYTGHNEYYGALGTGSVHRLGLNRNLVKLIIRLKKLKLVQLGFLVSEKLHNQFSKDNHRTESGLMIKMAGDQEIEYNSGIYKKGLRQFENNMREVLQKFNGHQIPVYFSDLVSNDRGQKPFVSRLDIVTDTVGFKKLFQGGCEAYKRNDKDNALKLFAAAEKVDSTFAMNNFLMAEILFDKGNFSEARRYYNNASELDVLRFRAPDDINRIIRKLSGQNQNVRIVHAEELFLQKSPHGILGNELFTDHLHPNLEGNFLLASAFYTALKGSLHIGKMDSDVGINTLRKEMPVTRVDSLQGTWLIQYMKQKWPFFDTVRHFDVGESYPEHLAFRLFNNQIQWDPAMDSLYKYYLGKHQIDEAIRVAKAYDLEHPYDCKAPDEIGGLYQQKGNYAESYYYFRKAYEKSHRIEFAKKIVIVLMKMDKPEECGYYLEIIRKQVPGDKTSANLMRMIENVFQAKNTMQRQPGNSGSIEILARYYLYIGNLNRAKVYIDKSPGIDPNDPLIREYYKQSKDSGSVNHTLRPAFTL